MKKLALFITLVLITSFTGYAKYEILNQYNESDSTFDTFSYITKTIPIKELATALDYSGAKHHYVIVKVIQTDYGNIEKKYYYIYNYNTKLIFVSFKDDDGFSLVYVPNGDEDIRWMYSNSDGEVICEGKTWQELVNKFDRSEIEDRRFIKDYAPRIIKYKGECETQTMKNLVNKQFQYSINDFNKYCK